MHTATPGIAIPPDSYMYANYINDMCYMKIKNIKECFTSTRHMNKTAHANPIITSQ